MPGSKFYILFNDNEQKIPIWFPTNQKQPIELLRKLIFRQLTESSSVTDRTKGIKSPDNLRLFFNGQELQDKYPVKCYQLNDEDVIKVISSSIETNCCVNDAKSSETSSSMSIIAESTVETEVQCDDYYEIGDFVDAFDPESGAWFPAKIVQITKSKSTGNENVNYFYYVKFSKSSLGNFERKSLSDIRPQPFRLIDLKQLQPGQMAMVLNNDENWYVASIESIQHSKRFRSTRIWLTFITEANELSFNRQMIKYSPGKIFRLESNVKLSERNDELNDVIKFGSKLERAIKPDCMECQDNPQIERCQQCGCQICLLKTEPSKQLICDECQCSTHLWCLNNPISEVPNDDQDWYCDKCRNESQQQIQMIQQKYLDNQQQSTTNGNPVIKWGYGMACTKVNRNQNRIPQSRHFGPIEGVPVGSWWRFRVQAAEAGVHSPLVAGIHGNIHEGAYSLVYSGANPNDIDQGDQIYYTANGTNVRSNDRKKKQRQIEENSMMKREILALALNCPVPINQQIGGHSGDRWNLGKPIRLLRNGNNRNNNNSNNGSMYKKNLRSNYLPKIGIRYDGLYKVVKYWPEADLNGDRIWRFLLRRDDPEPAPWTEKGRYQSRKLGLILQYPNGWCKDLAQKRLWKIDKKFLDKNQQKNDKKIKLTIEKDDENNDEIDGNQFQIPANLIELIQSDQLNSKIWTEILEESKNCKKIRTKNEFLEKIHQSFQCIFCLDLIEIDSCTTLLCGHNFCLECLETFIQSNDDNDNDKDHQKPICPICRNPFHSMPNHQSTRKKFFPEKNLILSQILNEIKLL